MSMSRNEDPETATRGDKSSVVVQSSLWDKPDGVVVQTDETPHKTQQTDRERADASHDSQEGHENDHGTKAELPFEDQSSRMPLRKLLMVYLGIGA